MANHGHRTIVQILPVFLLLVAGVLGLGVISILTQSGQNYDSRSRAASGYNPNINPRDFSTKIRNKYLTLPIGGKLVYEGETEDGLERTEITVDGETKKVMGVNTLVYRDKVWIDGVMVEDTKDYIARNVKTGDIWYFGEDVNNYENGQLVDHDGSWLAGVDGAKPGIWVKQNPKVGEIYLQEYYAGVAEDTVEVLSVNESITTVLGSFTNCLKTYDYTPLDETAKEYKYYCPQVRAKVLTEHLVRETSMPLIEAKNRATREVDDREDREERERKDRERREEGRDR